MNTLRALAVAVAVVLACAAALTFGALAALVLASWGIR